MYNYLLFVKRNNEQHNYAKFYYHIEDALRQYYWFNLQMRNQIDPVSETAIIDVFIMDTTSAEIIETAE